MARRKNTITRFLEDIIDDTKDFVDDLLDRAKDAEEDVRDAVRNVVDDDEDEPKSTSKSKRRSGKSDVSAADLKALHAAVAELTATVNTLATEPTTTRRSTTKVA
jgi:hypothetical protein